MIEFELKPAWVTESGKKVAIDQKLLDTLRAIEKHQTITSACKALGVSYRTLWSLIQRYNLEFEAELIGTSKGSGTTITALGHQLLWMVEHGRIRLEKEIHIEADKLNKQWQISSSTQAASKWALSDDPLVPSLLQSLRKQTPVTVHWGGSIAALSAFHRGEVEIAGCHLPIGMSKNQEIHNMMQRWLRGEDLWVLPLFEREIGWISRPSDTPPTLESVAAGHHKLLNRNASSSTFYQLKALVNAAGLNENELPGWNDYEDTHMGLACSVGAGLADLGLGVRYAAEHFGLQFRRANWDRYFLVFRKPEKDSALHETLTTLSPILQSLNLNENVGYHSVSHEVQNLHGFLQNF